METSLNYDGLKAPFSPTLISFRVGATTKAKDKGIALAYLTARDVMERLDEVCGPDNWQCRYPFSGCCDIGIRINGDWIWKSNGAGQTDIEGDKGIFSDAFKRAAVLWGIGRYLYDLPNTWYPIEPHGNSYRFTQEAEKQMTQYLHDWQYKRVWDAPNDRKKFLEAIDNAWAAKDADALKQHWDDMTNEQKSDIWAALKEFSAKRAEIKRLLGVH